MASAVSYRGTAASADGDVPLFQLRNQNLEYEGRAVLNGITLTIRRGEKIALIGKSGAGKSTLLKHLREQLSGDCAWCPQAPGLVPMLSVYHNIYVGGLDRFGALSSLINLLRPRPEAKTEIGELAATLGLSDNLWRSVDQLSGGQQQRVAVGRALFQHKPVLLADEPVSALDDYQSTTLLSALVDRHETAIIALHDVSLAKSVCKRVIGLGDGKITFDCTAAELNDAMLANLYQ